MISCNEEKFIFRLCHQENDISIAIKNSYAIGFFMGIRPKLLIVKGQCYIMDSYNFSDYFDEPINQESNSEESRSGESSSEDSKSYELAIKLKKACKFSCSIVPTVIDFTNSWKNDNFLEYSDLPIGYILNIIDDACEINKPKKVPKNSLHATAFMVEAKSDKDFYDNFFSEHVKQHSENLFKNLGLEKDSDGYYNLFGEFHCPKSTSAQYLISQLIRRKNKDLIEKVCKAASEDPLRKKTDLSLILYSEPDKECLEIAEKYGYYKPEEIDHLEIAGNYISYSEARAVFKYGTQELKIKLLKFLFGSQKILMSCNVNALYDVMIEKYPELEEERDFFHNKIDGHLLIPHEVFRTTLLCKRMNLF